MREIWTSAAGIETKTTTLHQWTRIAVETTFADTPIKYGGNREFWVEKEAYEKMKLAASGLYNSIKLAPHLDQNHALSFAEEVLGIRDSKQTPEGEGK